MNLAKKKNGSGNNPDKFFTPQLPYNLEGVFLPKDFWNTFICEFFQTVPEDLQTIAQGIIEKTIAESAYALGEKILSSQEFKNNFKEVNPPKEIVFQRLLEILTSFHWGEFEIISLKPNEKATIRITNIFEKCCLNSPKCDGLMLKATLKAFMDLVYSEKNYPESFGTFAAKVISNDLTKHKYLDIHFFREG